MELMKECLDVEMGKPQAVYFSFQFSSCGPVRGNQRAGCGPEAVQCPGPAQATASFTQHVHYY